MLRGYSGPATTARERQQLDAGPLVYRLFTVYREEPVNRSTIAARR
jgi:hypothetical protein